MKLPRQVVIGLGVAAVIAVVVVVLLFMNLSAPKKRTITLEPRRVTVDEVTARKEVDRRIADYRAKGEPIGVADFVQKPVDPQDDAAAPYIAAAKWLDTKEIGDDPVWNLDIIFDKLTDAQWRQIDAAVKKMAPALAMIDQADGRQGADWKIKMTSPVLRTLLPALNGARQSANLLQLAALSAHHAGRHDEVVHRLTQITMLARHVDAGHSFLVGHLVAIGIARIATQTITDILPTLNIAPASVAAPPEGYASRAQVNALIAALLDPRTLENGWQQCALAERMAGLDSVNCLIDGRLRMQDLFGDPRQKNATSMPTPPPAELLDDLRGMLDFHTALVAATKLDRLPEFRAAAPSPAGVPRSQLGQGLLPSYDRAASVHFAGLTELRLAATALALRAYAADHNGALPAALNELVPQYLPALPDDPLVAAPATILYRDGMVYSAGVNEGRLRRLPSTKSATAKPPPAPAPPTKPDYAIRVIAK